MYLDYFGFKKKPFSNTPDPEFLFLSKNHEEALSRLQYAVEENELALLVGEIGSGKTTLSRALIDSFDENYKFFLIINSRLSPSQFLRTLVKLFGEEPKYFKNDLLEQIENKLLNFYEKSITPAIIMDEAQLIPKKGTFDEIRLLTNFQMDSQNLMSFIIMGQPELSRRLQKKAYDPLRQRISLNYYLKGLNEDEVFPYIKHRLSIAGGDPNLFSFECIPLIYKFSNGIPRVINTICSLSLLEAMGKDTKKITPDIVIKAFEETELKQEV